MQHTSDGETHLREHECRVNDALAAMPERMATNVAVSANSHTASLQLVLAVDEQQHAENTERADGEEQRDAELHIRQRVFMGREVHAEESSYSTSMPVFMNALEKPSTPVPRKETTAFTNVRPSLSRWQKWQH